MPSNDPEVVGAAKSASSGIRCQPGSTLTEQAPSSPPSAPSKRQDALLFGAILAGSLAVQFSFDRVVGADGFFHIRQALHPLGGMPWMPLSIFGDGWVDHQLLFHVALSPFALLLDGVPAAKLGAGVFAAVAIEALRRVLRARRVPYPTLFALLPAAVSWRFLLRMEMPRTQSLSLALLLVGVWALLHERRRVLFAVAWVYAWTYQVALLLLPVAVLYAVVRKLRGAAVGPAPVLVAGGLAAGFTLHPHSPGTWRFIHQHVVLKVLNRDALPVGGEWTEGGLGTLLATDPGGLVVLALALALIARRRSDDAVFLGALAACATVGAVLSIKFIEYSVPLSCLALGAALRDAARGTDLAARLRVPLAVAVFAGLAVSAGVLRSAVLATEPPPDRLAPAMATLDAHADPGDVVYHFGWSDFPELVFHGPEYRYIVGLDPHFLALERPELWELYAKIERGWGTNPSKPIARRFGAKWAVLVLPHEGAEALLGADPGLEVLHRDPHAVVYAVAP